MNPLHDRRTQRRQPPADGATRQQTARGTRQRTPSLVTVRDSGREHVTDPYERTSRWRKQKTSESLSGAIRGRRTQGRATLTPFSRATSLGPSSTRRQLPFALNPPPSALAPVTQPGPSYVSCVPSTMTTPSASQSWYKQRESDTVKSISPHILSARMLLHNSIATRTGS